MVQRYERECRGMAQRTNHNKPLDGLDRTTHRTLSLRRRGLSITNSTIMYPPRYPDSKLYFVTVALNKPKPGIRFSIFNPWHKLAVGFDPRYRYLTSSIVVNLIGVTPNVEKNTLQLDVLKNLEYR